jgi:hypothetical protein
MTYTCGHILRNNTKPNERKSAGGIVMAQSTAEDRPEDGQEKRPKHVGVLYLQTRL